MVEKGLPGKGAVEQRPGCIKVLVKWRSREEHSGRAKSKYKGHEVERVWKSKEGSASESENGGGEV